MGIDTTGTTGDAGGTGTGRPCVTTFPRRGSRGMRMSIVARTPENRGLDRRLAALLPVLLLALAAGACTGIPGDVGGQAAGIAFEGARIVDGTGAGPLEDGVLLVREGRIAAVGPRSEVEVPEGARTVDLEGRTVVPGIVNAHGHVGQAQGLRTGPDVYTRDNILDQLRLSARYGVTTVVSLGGGGPEGVAVRDEQDRPDLERARLRLAGPVLSPDSPSEVPELVDELRAMDVDWVKFRVDDFLGRGTKMSPQVYDEIIEEAHERGLPAAAHIVDLADAKGVLRSGADLIAHSVRDTRVDDELVDLLLENDVCVSPTLAREVSTFVYRDRPDFFDDPFFTREVDDQVMEALLDPDRQASVRASESARYYEEALPVAQENLRTLHDAGVGIAFGTDSGPAARFQGYFEHMELELMAEAGLEPAEILRSATGEAARCMGLDDEVGTLEEGKWADFVVLRRDPLDDVRNLRAIESVWIAGNEVPGSRWDPAETGLGER